MNVFIHSVELSCEREGHSFSILPREIEECKRISRREAQKPHQKQRLNATLTTMQPSKEGGGKIRTKLYITKQPLFYFLHVYFTT